MKFKNVFIVVTFLITVFTLESCIPSKPAEDQKVFPADRLIKKIEGNRRKVKTFYGKGIINVESPKFTGSANFEVYLKKPDSIKISVYGPFGIDLAHAIVTKNNFEFYDVLKNTLYTGRSDAKVLNEIFKIDLSFDDLIDAFSGSVNMTEKLKREPDIYQENGDVYLLTYFSTRQSTKNVYKINGDNLSLLDFSVKNMKDKDIIVSKFSKIEMFDDVPIPYQTDVEYAGENQKLSLEYRKIEINKSFDDFSIKLPRDVKEVKWQ